ncbi:hypothetical protein DFH94DRAFT_856144 [Russula ochroleuca]|uniref:F-box domain-containing protein n=1 Tax=Russula ochroleuca TaxID=152965 RepID=A0A9P5K0A2_9AGAM|nr:hypothetical protein DFH94DRAFT_856144 [Russula ochroleuca]
MSTVLSLPEELVIEILLKADHRILLACQRACRTFNVIIRDSLALQYIISLAACGMQDDLSTIHCQGTAERLQRLCEHEAAWREVAWSDGGIIANRAACDFPTAISGSVLAFLKQFDGNSGDSDLGDRLFLLRIPSKLRGIPGESWELSGLGEMSNLCIDAAQDLLLFHRACKFHVRALSSGNVHPLVLHSGAFDMGMGTSDVAETPVVCCYYLAAIVHEHAWSQTTLTIKGTIIVWNWRTGNQVVVLRPLFARLGRDIAFLDEKHILIPASAADSALKPGQNYELMLLVYEFKTSTIASVNKVVAYCFQTALPVRTGLATFRHARISVNTASFSPPTDTDSNSNSNSFPRGYFYADPKDRIITLEVTDNNWMQNMEETAELYVPTRTFLAYMAAHPPLAVSAVRAGTGAGGPIVDVPWEEWGPCGAHLVRTVDQTYIIRRPRSCGMRVLGAPLSKKSVVVADYHPGRVARSAAAAAACVRAPAPAQRPVGTLFSSSSESHVGTGTETGATTRTLMRTRRRCFPPLVRVTKEVPLPAELQDALESPWTMLCEDALLAFEYVPDGFEISRVFAYTF